MQLKKALKNCFSQLLLFAVSPSALAALDSPTLGTALAFQPWETIEKGQALTQANLYSRWTPDSAIDSALSDSLGRVSDGFNIPTELRNKVRFWAIIFGSLSQYQTAIYDTEHPEIVYEVLDFSSLKRRARNLMVYEILRERKIESTLRDYEAAFNSLARDPNRSILQGKQVQIVRALGGRNGYHGHSLLLLKSKLRAQTGLRDHLIQGLVRAQNLLPTMRHIFESEGIPPELIPISLVESSFNHAAVSKSGAVGVWQIMPTTGKHYLKLGISGIDERVSPFKSTRAAARILRENFKILKNWPMAVTAYNSGFRGILKIPASARTGDEVFGRLRACAGSKHLGIAGRNYYAEFLAVLYVVEYRDLVFAMTADPGEALSFEVRRTPQKQARADLLRREGIDSKVFDLLNPDLKKAQFLPKGMEFLVPTQDGNNVGLRSEPLKPVGLASPILNLRNNPTSVKAGS